MNFLKELRFNIIISSIVYIILGVLLLINPEAVGSVLCNILGALLIVIGIISIIRYFTFDIGFSFYRNDFLIGIIQVLFGLFIIIYKVLVISFIPLLIGFFVIISGISKFQDSIDAFRLHLNYSWIYLILAIISIMFGILIVTNPFDSANILFMVIGAGLIYSGISDLFTTIYLSKKVKNSIRNSGIIDGKFKEL